MKRLAPLLPWLVCVLIVAVMLPAHASSRGGSGVQILQIVFNPPGRDNGSNSSLKAEYVVIRNAGSRPVNLTGWTLRDSDRHVFRFPVYPLGPGDAVAVHTGRGQEHANHLYWDSSGYIWNNDGDTATLRRRDGSRVDVCTYSGAGSTVIC